LSASDAALALQAVKNDFVTCYRILDVISLVATQAVVIAKNYGLRGYDAVQLASALRVRTQLLTLGISSSALSFTFISADVELNTAAQLEGLAV
jgi:uncharacterized protein